MAKFNMLDLLGEQDATQPPQAKNKAQEKGEGSFPIEYINVNLLDPSSKNFYSTKDIEELADSILHEGLLQNLVVRPKGDGRYRMIAGHRRRLAILLLVEQGHTQFEYTPCLLQNGIDDIDEELKLIQTNKQARTPSGWELVQEAQRVRVLLELKAQQEKTPGKMRDRMAKTLKTSPTQVARLEAISRNLIPEFMEELKAERLALNTAYELSGMPEERQRAMLEQHQQKDGGLMIPDVRKEKEAAAPVQEDTPPPTPPTPPAIPKDTPAAPPSHPVQDAAPSPAHSGSGKPSTVPQVPQPAALVQRSALYDLISATIQGKDIELAELDGDSASVLLPYDTAEYEVVLEGDTDRERLSSFKAGVNKLLRNMMDHIGDCLLDGEE